MTDALDDPFIHQLFDQFGHAGYVAWFGLIEIIGRENGKEVTGKLLVSPAYLKRKLRISSRKLEQIFGFCQTFGKLSVNFSKDLWGFEFPKMLSIKDNYTSDLEVTSKKLSIEAEAEAEAEEDIDISRQTTSEVNDFVEAYNRICVSLPKVLRVTDSRRRAIGARLKEHSLESDFWSGFFERVERSDWLSGRNEKAWKASFDWILLPRNFIKIQEGNYDNNTTPNRGNSIGGIRASEGKYANIGIKPKICPPN